jgi:Na+-translocating ferredoxin:NAD+ oxidoreductase RNF subunit RnfB
MEELINILIATGVLVVVAILASILLAVAESRLSVNDDKNKHVEKIEFYLPSYNCGACGHVNCRQVAKEIVDGKINDLSICKVISEDNAKLIKEYCKENNIEIK